MTSGGTSCGQAAKGEMSDKETEKAIELATEVRQMWDQRKLQSSIRSVYQRTAFQRSDSNKVRAGESSNNKGSSAQTKNIFCEPVDLWRIIDTTPNYDRIGKTGATP